MKNKVIDQYIAKAQPFAQPILKHLRELIHQACPEVTETIKWSFPVFEYKGPLCNIAAFKQHCVLGFWKASLLDKEGKVLTLKDRNSMGHLGRITSLAELPSDATLLKLIKLAVKLNQEGVKVQRRVSKTPKIVAVPDAFQQALKRNQKAKKVFETFSQSHQNEYNEWIAEAKTDATRDKRIATAMEWIADGKGRNWKYESKTKLQ